MLDSSHVRFVLKIEQGNSYPLATYLTSWFERYCEHSLQYHECHVYLRGLVNTASRHSQSSCVHSRPDRWSEELLTIPKTE